MGAAGHRRSVAEGEIVVPDDWPKWALKCTAQRRKGRGPCRQWAVVGMPTCRFHGSGGEQNRQIGQLRYLCWIITGGPRNQPVALAARVALAVFCEAVLNQGKGSPETQMKAALWITQLGDRVDTEGAFNTEVK